MKKEVSVFRHPKMPHSFFVLSPNKDGILVGYRYWFRAERKKFTPGHLLFGASLKKAGWVEFEDTELLREECEQLCLEDEFERKRLKKGR